MAWIESHQEIGRHPKTRKLARQLGVSLPAAVGHLHLLWHWCLDFAEDGILSDYEYDEIADGALWEGDAETFVRALITCGWLDDSIEISVHDWSVYTGRIQAAREANRERQKRYRERQKASPDDHSNSSNDDVTVTNPSRNGATVPNRTQPNQTEQEPEENEVARGRAVALDSPHGMCLVFLDAMGKADTDVAPKWFDENRAHTKEMLEQGINPDKLRRYVAYERGRGKESLRLRYVKKDILDWEASGEPDGTKPRGSPKPDPNQRTLDNYQKNLAVAQRVGSR